MDIVKASLDLSLCILHFSTRWLCCQQSATK